MSTHASAAPLRHAFCSAAAALGVLAAHLSAPAQAQTVAIDVDDRTGRASAVRNIGGDGEGCARATEAGVVTTVQRGRSGLIEGIRWRGDRFGHEFINVEHMLLKASRADIRRIDARLGELLVPGLRLRLETFGCGAGGRVSHLNSVTLLGGASRGPSAANAVLAPHVAPGAEAAGTGSATNLPAAPALPEQLGLPSRSDGLLQAAPGTGSTPAEHAVASRTSDQAKAAETREALDPAVRGGPMGSISGELAYPSDFIPPDMRICARDTETGVEHCNARKERRGRRHTYSLAVPAGNYHVYATTSEMKGYKAYYSDHVVCGLKANCSSHRPVIVMVFPGGRLSGIHPTDWYAPMPDAAASSARPAASTDGRASARPTPQMPGTQGSSSDAMRAVAPPVMAGNGASTSGSPPAQAARGRIEGTLSYPSNFIPRELTICAYRTDTREQFCTNRHLRGPGRQKAYRLEVPEGSYHVFAREGSNDRAYYSEFSRCGNVVGCGSHKPAVVTVRSGERVSKVEPSDFYDHQQTTRAWMKPLGRIVEMQR